MKTKPNKIEINNNRNNDNIELPVDAPGNQGRNSLPFKDEESDIKVNEKYNFQKKLFIRRK